MAVRGKRVLVAAVGDANNPITWSGIPYHMLQAGGAIGLFDEGLRLATHKRIWTIRRYAWNLRRIATAADGPGGYQYSDDFLERLWTSVREHVRDAVVVSCFQLFPPSIVADSTIEKWFCTDMTLTQLFRDYGLGRSTGRNAAEQALKREREGYDKAVGIIMHSQWAADSVVRDYGIPADKVHVVVAGASIESQVYDHWEQRVLRRVSQEQELVDRPLRLVFVGKDWRRKGLDRLLRAFVLARNGGFNGTLRVVGCDRRSLPAALQRTGGVEWCGFVDKGRDALRFLDLIAECDLACHLSRAEAGGIAQREFHALGLAILGTDVGGARAHRLSDASVDVPADASDEFLAEQLVALGRSPQRVCDMKAAAWRHRRECLWSASIEKLASLLRSRGPRAEPGPGARPPTVTEATHESPNG
ncbi:MAG: glycosyltransferase family 4 protein [Deltaproteobacteria bacterium]|nr:glycosyltransferase family 4 protein [Deltaproteobacteria bacterium]